MKRVLLFLLLCCSQSVVAAQVLPETGKEVDTLLEVVRHSPCQFNRNGSWYTSNEAAEHIDKKYHAALEKGLIHSTEDFIAYAATKSSISGKPYIIQCSGNKEITCAEWLTDELHKVREEKKR